MSATKNPQTFLVTGATGWQGGSLARALLAKGHTVHALVRDPSSAKAQALANQGVVIFKGSFEDADVIRAAAEGCSGVFLNPFPTPGDFDSQIPQTRNVVNAAVEANCSLVLSTCVFSSQPDKWADYGEKDFLYLFFSRKHMIEQEVRSAPLRSYTIIRPPYLFHNYMIPFSRFHYPELATHGVLRDMQHDGRRFAHGDSADTGKIAAVVLENPEKYNKLEIDFAVSSMTTEDAAAAIRKVAKRADIRTEKVSDEGFDTVVKTGLTWHYFANTKDVELANPQQIYNQFGVKLTTFEQYLERERDLLEISLPASG